MRAGVEPDPLLKWAQGPELLNSTAVRIIAGLIALLTIASLVIWASTGRHLWFFAMVLVEMIFVYCLRRIIRPAVGSVEKACLDLQLLSLVLARLEKEQFKTDHLGKLRVALDREGMPPSRLIARLSFITVLLDSRRNQFFAPIAFILLWEIQLAFFVELWRRKYGHAIAGWLEATAEMEALTSLAGYAYENPNDPFPELSVQSPCFEGQGLGHPLLPQARCVRNDVSLTGESRALVVSGSNMSGKSTLLRTVGINAVLALAGAPVRAKRLRIAPLALGASIRITDSLQGGTSRFYAEITRLKQLVTLAEGPIPLMFLLDELLHGTNSHDRRIGAEAVIKGLIRRGAIGLLTTHDLALAHIVDALAPHAANVHFEDHIENGRIAFDYHLRPGIVRKSNALELMRSIGLEV
jgi:DNA mismatch repair ATPase MutS